MKAVTVAAIQSVFALIATIINASMQAYGLSELNKSKVNNADIETAKKLLLASVIFQFVAAVLMTIVAILIIVNRQKLENHMNKLIYVALFLSGCFLLIGGALGASVAVRLQCYRSDDNVNNAWRMSAITAGVGVTATLSLLLIQSVLRKEKIKSKAYDYLARDKAKRRVRELGEMEVPFKPPVTPDN